MIWIEKVRGRNNLLLIMFGYYVCLYIYVYIYILKKNFILIWFCDRYDMGGGVYLGIDLCDFFFI